MAYFCNRGEAHDVYAFGRHELSLLHLNRINPCIYGGAIYKLLKCLKCSSEGKVAEIKRNCQV